MKTTITPILGRVFCPDGDMVQDDFKGQPNSTRWVFDVEHEFEGFKVASDPEALELFHVQLAEHRTGKIFKIDVFSFSIGAMSESFYDARPHIEIRNGLIHIVVRVLDGGNVKYRIAVDTIYSAHR